MMLVLIKRILSYFQNQKADSKSDTEKSWDDVEKFYSRGDINIKWQHGILSLIKEIRQKGFDKTLYAGISLYSLRISKKPVDNGYTPSQSLIIEQTSDGIEIHRLDIKLSLHYTQIAYSLEIEKLLQEIEKS